MNNIMLGKKELASVLAILVCVTIYFIYEYFTNQQKNDNTEIVEKFQSSQMGGKKLDELREINMKVFGSYKNYVIKEKDLFRNDIDIANYFIRKKFNLDQIIRKPVIEEGVKTYVVNPKMDINNNVPPSLLYSRKTFLKGIIDDIILTIDEIDNLESKNKFYEHFKNMLFEIKNIYEDQLTYFTEGAPNYLDLEKINNKYINDSSVTSQAGVDGASYEDIISIINSHIINSNRKFKDSSENLEKSAMDLITFIDSSNSIDKNIKNKLISLIESRLQITLKIVVRSLSFNFIDTIILLGLSGKLSKSVANDKIDAAKESNVIVGELVELFNSELEHTDKIIEFFRKSEKGSIDLVDNEFKYFNTVDNNTNTLINFCKKMKKMDRPTNNNMIFKRMAREFVKKKNSQIDKLQNDVNQMMGEMSVTQAYNQNLYTLRTSDESQKQINAIKQAQENIDSMGKFKINLK